MILFSSTRFKEKYLSRNFIENSFSYWLIYFVDTFEFLYNE